MPKGKVTKTQVRKFVKELADKIKEHGLLYPKGDLSTSELRERIEQNIPHDFSNTAWSLIRYIGYGGSEVPDHLVTQIRSEESRGSYGTICNFLTAGIDNRFMRLLNK